VDIICFANDWDGDPLSKKHIMRRLAARGSRVLWVSSLGNRAPRVGDAGDWKRAFRKLGRFVRSAAAGPRPVEDGIWVLDPIAVPSYGSRAIAALNGLAVAAHVRTAAARLGFRAPVHYTFVPASAWVAGRLDESLLVYHAADEYGAFGGADAAAIGRLEDELLRRADLYVACSQPLYDAKAPKARAAALLRHGVEHAHFARALDPAVAVAPAVAALPGPRAGFIGLVAEWVDLHLLARTADALAARGGSLVVVGEARGADPAALAALRARPNVLLTGRLPYADLPGVLKGLDVALLTFTVDPLTRAANPLKLREYLAAGLPVVSTEMPEARALATLAPGALRVAADPDDFVKAVLAAATGPDRGPKRWRSEAVAGEAWDAKVVELEGLLARTLPPKGNGASTPGRHAAR
jgi:glycosyltransferase involved in cell wall biosynthesis